MAMSPRKKMAMGGEMGKKKKPVKMRGGGMAMKMMGGGMVKKMRGGGMAKKDKM